MGRWRKLLDQLVSEYGDDIARTVRGVMGPETKPTVARKAAERLAVRKGVPSPRTATAAIPAREGLRHPVREGYRIHDRGSHAALARRYQAIAPDGSETRFAGRSGNEVWDLTTSALNRESDTYKPRGGQWFPEEHTLSERARVYGPRMTAVRSFPRGTGDLDPERDALKQWWLKAVPKYLQNDLGTVDDPLRTLADRGLLEVAPDADTWTRTVNHAMSVDPAEFYTVPKHQTAGGYAADSDLISDLAVKAPWMAKLPVSEPIYGFSTYGHADLGLPHIADEMLNALDPTSGLPPDLAVRADSLSRMSFPQAAERVGQIGKWREAQARKAQLDTLQNNPAIHLFKEYPDDNPRGLRWVELRAPEAQAPDGWSPVTSSTGAVEGWRGPDGEFMSANSVDRKSLEEALRYEGDTMGHCVGGYCDEVLGGNSRIFSLRDAAGEPHVTIETAPMNPYYTPNGLGNAFEELQPGVWDKIINHPDFHALGGHGTAEQHFPELWDKFVNRPDNIVQIKGKQNRAPVDEYLPYVQDFVKSGTWGNIGDFGNTGLVRLPDGRYITKTQLSEVVGSQKALDLFGNSDAAARNLADWNLKTFSDEDWNDTRHLFEGFAVGGRVSADRCFCRNPLSVR